MADFQQACEKVSSGFARSIVKCSIKRIETEEIESLLLDPQQRGRLRLQLVSLAYGSPRRLAKSVQTDLKAVEFHARKQRIT
jgi:hypothetical protein